MLSPPLHSLYQVANYLTNAIRCGVVVLYPQAVWTLHVRAYLLRYAHTQGNVVVALLIHRESGTDELWQASHSWHIYSQTSNPADGETGNASVIESKVRSHWFLCHAINWQCVFRPWRNTLWVSNDGFKLRGRQHFVFFLWSAISEYTI